VIERPHFTPEEIARFKAADRARTNKALLLLLALVVVAFGLFILVTPNTSDATVSGYRRSTCLDIKLKGCQPDGSADDCNIDCTLKHPKK